MSMYRNNMFLTRREHKLPWATRTETWLRISNPEIHSPFRSEITLLGLYPIGILIGLQNNTCF